MIEELEAVNKKIVAEADRILYEVGLLHLLNRYGVPRLTGSYSLNTMTWRDLDIYLTSDGMTNTRFLELGRDLVGLLDPRRMVFRNEFIGKTEGLPSGFYLGLYTQLSFEEEWKIDIWALDTQQAEELLNHLEGLRVGLSEEKRKTVLEIKTHYCHRPEYRVNVKSQDIYKAVIMDNVNSLESFKEWLSTNKE